MFPGPQTAVCGTTEPAPFGTAMSPPRREANLRTGVESKVGAVSIRSPGTPVCMVATREGCIAAGGPMPLWRGDGSEHDLEPSSAGECRGRPAPHSGYRSRKGRSEGSVGGGGLRSHWSNLDGAFGYDGGWTYRLICQCRGNTQVANGLPAGDRRRRHPRAKYQEPTRFEEQIRVYHGSLGRSKPTSLHMRRLRAWKSL